MYHIKLFNKISPTGLSLLDSKKYNCGEDVEKPDGILVRSASLHGVEFPESVRAIARAGAGTNNIPIDECSKRGIVVFNTPGGNANAVKELTIAGLLLSARKIFPSMQWAQSLKGQDNVEKLVEDGKKRFAGPEIKGKKLGVIGLGAIGVMVCNAAIHMGMEVYGYDPYLTVEGAWGLSKWVHRAISLREIYEKCDFITLHVPLNSDTKNMINSQSLNMMKSGVRLLNFSRGELVDVEELLPALDEKKVYCYITDFPSELALGHPGIIALPHLGASTPESEENCAEMAARQLRDFLENGNITNAVNLPNVHAERNGGGRVTVMHKNVPNMISQISGAMAGANISNLTNKSRGDCAYTVIDLDGGITDEIMGKIKAIDGVIRVTALK